MIMDTISTPTLFEDLEEIISTLQLSDDDTHYIKSLLENQWGYVPSLAEYERENYWELRLNIIPILEYIDENYEIHGLKKHSSKNFSKLFSPKRGNKIQKETRVVIKDVLG